MVSFARAFFRVSAAVAASLTDPTTTKPEVPKPRQGSLVAECEPVLHWKPTEKENSLTPSTAVCTTEKNLSRFKQFRPCRRIAEKARNLKLKIKRRLKLLAKKNASKKAKICISSGSSPQQPSGHLVYPIVPFLTSSPSLIPYGYLDDELTHFLIEKEDLSRNPGDTESDSYNQLVQVKTEHENTIYKATSNSSEFMELSCSKSQFSVQFFKGMMFLFEGLQSFTPFTTSIHATILFTKLSLYNPFQPVELDIADFTAAGLPFLILRSRNSQNVSTVPPTSSHGQLKPRLQIGGSDCALPETVKPHSKLLCSTDDDLHAVEASGERSTDKVASNDSKCLDVLAIKSSDKNLSSNSSEIQQRNSALQTEQKTNDQTSESSGDESLALDAINNAVKKFPYFQTFRLLRKHYLASPIMLSEGIVHKPVVSFSKCGKTVTYHGNEAPNQLDKGMNSESACFKTNKSCLKTTNLKQSPSSSLTCADFGFSDEWFQELGVRFEMAACIDKNANAEERRDQMENFIAVSQLTFSKLAIGIVEVRSNSLAHYTEDCVTTRQLLGEVFSISFAISTRYQVLLEEYKHSKSYRKLNKLKRSVLSMMKYQCNMKLKLSDAISRVSQVDRGYAKALTEYNNRSKACVTTVKKVLKKYDWFVSRKLCQEFPSKTREELNELCGRTEYNSLCGKYETKYLKHAQKTTKSVLKDMLDAVESLGDLSVALEEALEYLYNDICLDISA